MASSLLNASQLLYPHRFMNMDSPNYFTLSFKPKSMNSFQAKIALFSKNTVLRRSQVSFATHEGASETEAAQMAAEATQAEVNSVDEPVSEYLHQSENGGTAWEDEQPASAVGSSLRNYKTALKNKEESEIAELEAFFLALEDEKNALSERVALLSAEVSIERDRILRISADFENFRKRTEREKLSLVENVQGEVVESLLPVLDNFERAKSQIKIETEGERKINNSYQSIYKQFIEILTSLGVGAVETVGILFDPLLHEAIMREDSTEYAEGIVIEEFRKGFKLRERLLRPSMVKVSAGPGPSIVNPEQVSSEGDIVGSEVAAASRNYE